MTIPRHDMFTPVQITAPDGATASVYPYGAHLASWQTSDGRERLFFSERAELSAGSAIRGGVPVCFPQFSRHGPLPPHGCVRTVPWECLGAETGAAGTIRAHFRLLASEATRACWPHEFQLDVFVTVGGMRLSVTLEVTNTDSAPFTFTGALHTYFQVDDITAVEVDGLVGLPYREFDADYSQTDPVLRIEGEVDRVYWNVPGPVTLREGTRHLVVQSEGFPDAVVWNPGPERCAKLPDMAPDGYQRMLCIESVVFGEPVTLQSGGLWRGTQHVEAQDG